MTQEQIDCIAALREGKGLSTSTIARMLGISKGSVDWNCLIHGIERHGRGKPLPQTAPGAATYNRKTGIVRHFTPEEDARLLELERQGLNPTAIGRKIDRRPNSVRGRLATLARHEERRADAAHG